MSKCCNSRAELPPEGFVRVGQLIGPHGILPIGRTTLWKLVRSGDFPQPIKLAGQRISAWRVSDVREAISRLSCEG